MKRDRERVSVSDFLAKFPDAEFLFELFADKIMIEKEEDSGKEYYWLTLETKFTRQYNIRVNVCDDGCVYFGAWSTNRLMEPFEDWHRGNDLSDGILSETVIVSFLHDMIDDLFVNAPKINEKQPWKGIQENCKE